MLILAYRYIRTIAPFGLQFCAALMLWNAHVNWCCRLRNKESNSVGKEMAKASNIGVNVSTFAQQIFNGLAKTYGVVALHFPTFHAYPSALALSFLTANLIRLVYSPLDARLRCPTPVDVCRVSLCVYVPEVMGSIFCSYAVCSAHGMVPSLSFI